MSSRHPHLPSRIPWSVLNRLAQINVAIAVTIGLMIRCSMEFSTTPNDRPDPLIVLGFFAAMSAAIWLVMRFRRELRFLRAGWQRILATVITFAIQFAVLELLILFVAEG